MHACYHKQACILFTVLQKPSMKEFEGKVVVITGAGSGIGKATALLFAEKGAKIVVAEFLEQKGKQTWMELQEKGVDAIYVHTNVAELASVNHLMSKSVEAYGRIDVLINNAGIGGGFSFFDQITDEDWDKVIAVNQTGVFYCMRAALRQMRTQESGVIVNVSSLAGIGSAPRMGAYAASKHAVVGMTKTAASEFAKFNIRINAVCPSVIRTPMTEGFMLSDPSVNEFLRQSIPMKRFGEAEEVARTICWLSSPGASFVTGETVRVDGGHRA